MSSGKTKQFPPKFKISEPRKPKNGQFTNLDFRSESLKKFKPKVVGDNPVPER